MLKLWVRKNLQFYAEIWCLSKPVVLLYISCLYRAILSQLMLSLITLEPVSSNGDRLTCAQSENSDQTAHLRSPIRVSICAVLVAKVSLPHPSKN